MIVFGLPSTTTEGSSFFSITAVYPLIVIDQVPFTNVVPSSSALRVRSETSFSTSGYEISLTKSFGPSTFIAKFLAGIASNSAANHGRDSSRPATPHSPYCVR